MMTAKRSVEAQGVTTTLRLEKGHDIDAACGQLRLKTEREMAGPDFDTATATP